MLNLDAINEMSEEIEKKTEGGNSFLRQKDLPEEADFRLLEPRPNMKGLFYVKEDHIWINQKKYISPASFGEKCPMMEVINEAIAKNDLDLTALLKRLEYNGNLEKILGTTYHIPALRMVTDARGNITETPEDNPVVLQCTTQLIQRLNKLVAHRNYRGLLEDGKTEYYITDMVKGHNLTLSKKEVNKRTEYDAIAGKQVAMDERFYAPDKLPNPVLSLKKQMFSDRYLVSVIRNYLYNDALIQEEKRYSEEELKEFQVVAAPVSKKKAPAKKAEAKPLAEKPALVAKAEEPVAETSVASTAQEVPQAKAESFEQPAAMTEKEQVAATGSIEEDLDDLG